jgi:4'-phosphopantetheinyl transferase EntD
VIERIVPAQAVAVEAFDDPPGLTLFAEEEAVVANAVEKRRAEFTTVRHCARQALARLGHQPVPILPGGRGAPRWPDGLRGSMTHCQGYRAAVLGRTRDLASIGVDAEPNEPLPDGVLKTIGLDRERVEVARLIADHPGIRWDRMLFSAKEAVYKTWYPLTGRWLDFTEADITFTPDTGEFVARLLVPGPVLAGREVRSLAGRFMVANGTILTAIALPA